MSCQVNDPRVDFINIEETITTVASVTMSSRHTLARRDRAAAQALPRINILDPLVPNNVVQVPINDQIDELNVEIAPIIQENGDINQQQEVNHDDLDYNQLPPQENSSSSEDFDHGNHIHYSAEG